MVGDAESRERTLLLEACVASVEAAHAARAGGADRLELCSRLDRDGLTPSPDLLERVTADVRLPIVAMVRPHDDGYAYGSEAFADMLRVIARFAESGADGVVVGVLRSDRTVDRDRLTEVVAAAGSCDVVFHRAFDEVPDVSEALEALVECGVRRVLTSGGRATAPAGSDVIRGLRERAAGRIELLPGAGVRPDNAAALVRATGCDQLHGTFSRPGDPLRATDPGIVARVRDEALRGLQL
ncbi:MAG: copper homeostasis protein CutC [Gemmatimonadetes bacterium]|nr:copper homeostasis protein CutC [Gemmatimonadota bacterium]